MNKDQLQQLLEADTTHGSLKPNTNVAKADGIKEDTKDNNASWAATLAHQERLKNLSGVRSTWRACQQRRFQLPTTDTPDAAFLWKTFAKHPKLVYKLIDHAHDMFQASGQIYPHLYETIISYWLPRDAQFALDYHHYMLVTLKLRTLPLRKLARSGRATYSPLAYDALLDIYRNSNERDIYDEVVPVLVDKGHMTLARQWHSLCTFRSDLPSMPVETHPVIQIFKLEASTISNPSLKFGSKAAVGTSKQPRKQHGRYNEELMRRLLGRDTAPIRFEDSFCARMFATQSISPASIIHGLTLVGVNEIGPQAVLAMASRTQPLEDLPLRFAELKAAGITLQGCVFSLAVEKFALERKWRLVRSMLDSDQHPNVFGDAEVQRALLEHYLMQHDHGQAQRTLAILTLFHNESSVESWNLLLQSYIKSSGPDHVMEVLRDMRSGGSTLTPESIMAIKGLLRRRQRGRKPAVATQSRFDDLRFVTRVFISILESGLGAISPISWREIIRRFGMAGRFRELRRLLFWLLCWYAPRSSSQFTALPKSPYLDAALAKQRAAHPERAHYFHFPGTIAQRDSPLHPIRRLFEPALQQALIIWGFRAGTLPNAPLEQSMLGATFAKKHYRRKLLQQEDVKRMHWSIGLKTLVQLRDMGVHVHYHTVLKALQAQFVVLFGYGRSRKKENRMVEQHNTLSYATYVREVNSIWGSQLFAEPEHVGKSMVHARQWHPRAHRKTNRRPHVTLHVQSGSLAQNPRGENLGPDLRANGLAQTHNGLAATNEPLHDKGRRQNQSQSSGGGDQIAALEELQRDFATDQRPRAENQNDSTITRNEDTDAPEALHQQLSVDRNADLDQQRPREHHASRTIDSIQDDKFDKLFASQD